jgi:hypothetical protein
MIGDHGDEFDERNLVLQLALGLVSACRRLDLVLERHGRGGAAPPAPPQPGDATLVEFVLGLIAFRDRAMGVLASARRPKPSAVPPERPRALRDLLR